MSASPPSSSSPEARARFLALLAAAVADGSLVKLTLGKPRGTDPSLRNLFVRPVRLKAGPHLALVWRHDTRDVTKNVPVDAAGTTLEPLIGDTFLSAHLFATGGQFQLEIGPDGGARLHRHAGAATPVSLVTHDRAKAYPVPADRPWLRALGVTNDQGRPREGMADKFRQIQKFAEVLSHLAAEAFPDQAGPLQVVDMGCGKGYLTFAVADLLGSRAHVCGVEVRPALVELGNRVAAEAGLGGRLAFQAGTIADAPLAAVDILIALHACDTATDDALARGIAAGARLLIVSPCCQKELRPQLTAPRVLRGPLRHGIFQERQAEFVTDALRAQLLEWAGYRTKVFEFISTEHTARNLMIAAVRTRTPGASDDERAREVSDLAAFYGIRHQALARHLGFRLGTTGAQEGPA